MVDRNVARVLATLEQELRSAGHSVFLSHRYEEFGAKLRPPEICTPFDLLEMQQCDCVVAFPYGSYGVHIELGWAVALNKLIVLALPTDVAPTSPLLAGLETVSRCRVLRIPADLLSNPVSSSLASSLVVEAVEAMPQPRNSAPTCAFIATSFGFGPVSKAVSLARELKRRAPHYRADYFGTGIAHEFAQKAEAFDCVYRINVDSVQMLTELLPALDYYQAVFSVLNLEILPLWAGRETPLHFVDSLAWMWTSPPRGVENVARYWVQDYMLGSCVPAWFEGLPLEIVGPIHAAKDTRERRISGRLLVNFSGCYNTFVPQDCYSDYVDVLVDAVLSVAADRFDEVIFCCSEVMAKRAEHTLRAHREASIAHFAHDEFLQLLATAEVVLTSPGITTTLEAMALDTPIRFLLPQNYSQCLLAERYVELVGAEACMALSRFGPEFVVAPHLDEREGVDRVVGNLRAIFQDRRAEVAGMIRQLIDVPGDVGSMLRGNLSQCWPQCGQEIIIERFLSG